MNHVVARMGIEALLERFVPTTDARCRVSHAQALGVLLRSIVVEREPIYRQQETAAGFAPGMFGIEAAAMAHLSDDRLGRALDRLYDADRAALLTEVVVAVGQRFGVRFDDLILTEVLQGFGTDADFDAARKLFDALEVVPLGGAQTCIEAARNFRALRRKGVTVRKTIDTIIATACIRNDYVLLDSDRDFDPFVEHLGLRAATPSLNFHGAGFA